MIAIDGLVVKTCIGTRKITMILEIGKIYYLNNEYKNNDFIKSLINYKQHPEISVSEEILGIIYISNDGYLINEFSGMDNLKFYQKQFKASENQIVQLLNYFEFNRDVKLKVINMNKRQKKILNIICLLLNMNAQMIIIEKLLVDLDKFTISKLKAYINKIRYDYVILFVSCNKEDLNLLGFCDVNAI